MILAIDKVLILIVGAPTVDYKRKSMWVMEKSSSADTQLPRQFDFLSSSSSIEKMELEGE